MSAVHSSKLRQMFNAAKTHAFNFVDWIEFAYDKHFHNLYEPRAADIQYLPLIPSNTDLLVQSSNSFKQLNIFHSIKNRKIQMEFFDVQIQIDWIMYKHTYIWAEFSYVYIPYIIIYS